MASAKRGMLPLFLGIGAGLATVLFAGRPLQYTRLLLIGMRQPLRRTPANLGLPYEDVRFPADDGLDLQGWFVPAAQTPAPAVVLVHGWPWNRHGNQAGISGIPDQNVDMLEPAAALREAGFNVLLFDLRNHGESAAAPPVTIGVNEARDFIGAVSFLRRRPEVDPERIGALGYSMGANTVMYGIPRCQPIRAAMLVQPTNAGIFARNLVRQTIGPPGPLLLGIGGLLHQAMGAPPLDTIDPVVPAALLGATVAQYIQGDGDPWGTMADVTGMVKATPHALPLIVAPATDRYDGYRYVNNHIPEVLAFFQRHL
jgi:uncharacterized protein